MSWQVGSFALVLLALCAAFWWYEHSQPPAKLVAVVATLAALAALGRDAFAAVPDVKPITTIVLVSGFAFGAGPGFAVGAISGLASNILLGEGPWTPWQMLGWGLVGLLGAALGRLSSRSLSPLALALACAASAEVFNLVLDLYTWTGTGTHSLASFGVVLGSAFVFDLTHVIASFAFGLAFASTLLRMLMRLRARLQITWQSAGPPGGLPAPPLARSPAGASVLLAVLFTLAALPILATTLAHASTSSSTPPAHSGALRTGVAQSQLELSPELAFLTAAQNRDGGFGGARGQSSSALYSGWVAIGLAAAGRDPLSLRSAGGRTVLDSLRSEAGSLHGAGDLERTILALRACGVSVRSFPGGDPVARMLAFRSRNGSFGGLSNLTAFAVFALRAAGYPPDSAFVRGAVHWLLSQQDSDGGFGFATKGTGSDIDDTAAVLQALVDGGLGGTGASRRAADFLIGSQNPDGGFPQERGGLSNAQSSAWAIQGLIAASRDVRAITRHGSRSPLGYLESLIAPDGSVQYSRTGSQTPVWVTAQALTALAGKPLPIAPVRTTGARAANPMRAIGALLSAILTPTLHWYSAAL